MIHVGTHFCYLENCIEGKIVTSENYKIVLRNNYPRLKASKNCIILISSMQIVSFMKYIFGIRPQFQYIKLQDRFTIVIQCELLEGSFDENKLNDLESLVNWLNYIRSKIKIIIVSSSNLNKKNKYTLGLSYENFEFVTFSQAECKTLLYEKGSDLARKLFDIRSSPWHFNDFNEILLKKKFDFPNF